MNTNQIQGELLIRGMKAADVARRLACSKSLVQKVIRGERATGPEARRVREAIGAVLEREVSEVWPESMEESVADENGESAESCVVDSAGVAA